MEGSINAEPDSHTNKEMDRQGYITMSAYYGQVCKN